MASSSGKRVRGRTPFLDMHALEIFEAVVDCGSMTAAAQRLSLTQPAISKAIAQLEGDLKSVLLDRALRPIRPTRAGLMLHERARRLLSDAENLRHGLAITIDEVLPSIRIGLVESVTATGAPLIRSLQAIADEVRVSSNLTPDLARGLLERDLDVLITSDPMEDVVDLERLLILHEPFVVAMPSARQDGRKNLDLKVLAEEIPFIRYTSRSIIGSSIEQHLRRYSIKVPRRLEFDASASLLTMVGAGLGWTITTPLCMVQGRADFASIHVAPLVSAPLARRLHVIARANELGSAPSRIQSLTIQLTRDVLQNAYGKGNLAWIMKQVEFGKAQTVTND